jgi:hypothetical protein
MVGGTRRSYRQVDKAELARIAGTALGRYSVPDKSESERTRPGQ